MNRSTIVAALLAALSSASCVTGTVTEPSVCDTADLGTIPAAPVAGVPLTTTFTSDLDFSGTITKLSDVTKNLQASVAGLTVHTPSEANWLQSVDVTISEKGSAATTPFARYVAPTRASIGDDITFQVTMDSATLLGFLKHPITLSYTLNGSSQLNAIVLDDSMCVAVSGKASKSF